ncbi:MAG: thioredoxin family protein [Chloroflexota bacterium]
MNIKILGTGCAKCHKLAQVVREVVDEIKLEAEVEEVGDIVKMLEYSILATPGLVINEKVVLSGQVPSKEKLIELFKNAAEKE